MNAKDIASEKELIFSGERLRHYLGRKGISYKMAAEQLGMDKNTVAKVVRGGNVNVAVILKICNRYGLNINELIHCRDEAAQPAKFRTHEAYQLIDSLQVLPPQEKAMLCEVLRKLLNCLEK